MRPLPRISPIVLIYDFRSKEKPFKDLIPSKGGLSLEPPQKNPMGRKYHLHKSQERATVEIKQEKQASITKALREGISLNHPT
jgi:hypothetical protein